MLSRRIAMVGCALTWKDAPFDDPDWEIWAHCSCQPRFATLPTPPRVTRWFDLHAVPVWRQGKDWYRPGPDDPPTYVGWLGARREPVVMQAAYSIVPTSLAYPIRAVAEAFGIVRPEWGLTPDDRKWWVHLKNRGEFSSTFSYMLALALYEGVDEIALYGIDFVGADVLKRERVYQRPGAKYWVGVARGMGIPVTVARGSWFEQQDALYGYVVPPLARELVEA